MKIGFAFVSIQSRFDTKAFLYTDTKSFRYKFIQWSCK